MLAGHDRFETFESMAEAQFPPRLVDESHVTDELHLRSALWNQHSNVLIMWLVLLSCYVITSNLLNLSWTRKTPIFLYSSLHIITLWWARRKITTHEVLDILTILTYSAYFNEIFRVYSEGFRHMLFKFRKIFNLHQRQMFWNSMQYDFIANKLRNTSPLNFPVLS